MDEPVVTGIAAFLSTIGSVFTKALAWLGDVCDMIFANPLLIFPIAIGVICLVIGVVRRFVIRAGI